MSRIGAVLALVAAVVIVYHNALHASFFDDDFQWLVGSWSFHPSQLVAFSSMSHFYRPVIDLYFAGMTPLLGGSPVRLHAASIALHAANVLVVYALVTRIARDRLFGFLTALFFAVQPSDVDAVAWVGALAEAIGVLFGCLALLWFLRWRDEGAMRYRTLSVGAYTLALLTHESSVVFLPVIVAVDWLQATGYGLQAGRPAPAARSQWIARFLPYAGVTALYLVIDLYINSRNYVVSEGHYTIGVHMIRNALDYVDALYVGRHDLVNDVVIAIGIALLLWRGNARVRFATGWMLLALAPFLAFTWGNTSRYLYQPAIGFSMLLAEAVTWIGCWTKSPRRRGLVVAALAAIITVRFAIFAASNVTDFTARSQVYPAYLARFKAVHPVLPAGSLISTSGPLQTTLPYQFVNAAVKWEYRDPTIQVMPYESSP